ncbi:MAG: AAA family ATPase [Candidatus Nanoarchaeia archaeon]
MVLVLGIIGRIGAGKDVATQYLVEKYGFKEIHMGNLVREELKELGIAESRENLQKYSRERTEQFGKDYWAKKVVQKIKELSKAGESKFVINGIRRLEEVELPKKEFREEFKLLLIEASPEIRFARLQERKRPGDPTNFEAFLAQEQAELKLYDFEKIESFADFRIKNEQDINYLYFELDKLVKNLGP